MYRPMRYLIAPLAAALILPIAASPAAADNVEVTLGRLGYGGVSNYNRTVYACDTAPGDGRVISTQYRLSTSGSGEVVDVSGPACGTKQTPRNVRQIRVCQTWTGPTSCTAWHSA